ncbi:Transcriptional_repressor NOT4Hp [Hexamita inflata]|uniref:Putative n=1 Tax=Hexamita inflata TaxID=28002 RepID=A0AA86VM21_9EUKA|nr:Transcriptional repressor NOT4Hp [Hexamita inflata]CAI9970528.1 Transcriptional repressor NOT4Hp [Hexamita inflata]
MSFGECPICCDEYTSPSMLEFFPCKCGYQPCMFCIKQMKQCPHCKELYQEANFRTIPNKFYSMSESERKQQRIVNKQNLIIRGLSDDILDEQILRQYNFLGQYGTIVDMQISNRQCYVKFDTESQALDCALAINFSYFDSKLITLTFGYQKFCTSFICGHKCHSKSCQFIHEATPLTKMFHVEDEYKQLTEATKIVCPREKENYHLQKEQTQQFPPKIQIQNQLLKLKKWNAENDFLQLLEIVRAELKD